MKLEVALRHEFKAFTLDAAFSAPAGVTALFGRSGSGKTTIVNAIAGLLRPQSGHVAIGETVLVDTQRGIFVPPHRRRVGYVFQDARLFPHFSVRNNLEFGKRFAPREAGPSLDAIATMLGIAHLLERRPAALSGGEKQRVAIGRALLSRPRLLLMDEPLASLDEARKGEILPYLERLRDEAAMPILYVSHSLTEVARLATTIIALREGKVARAGPAAAMLADPQAVPDLGVREAGAIFEATIVAQHPQDGLTELDVSAGRLFLPHIEAPAGARIRLRIHAHDVILATERPRGVSALNILPATIVEIREGEGPGAAVSLACGDDRLLARVTRRSIRTMGIAPGSTCFAILKSTAVAPSDISAGGDLSL